MPIWIRNLTFSRIQKYFDEQNNKGGNDVVSHNKQVLSAAGYTADKVNENKKVNIPTYVTNSPKKNK